MTLLPEKRHAAIEQQLKTHFKPDYLEVLDESHLHIGHPGHQGAGHFALSIRADIFNNKSLLECHKMIYAALDNMMGPDIHALRIKIIK